MYRLPEIFYREIRDASERDEKMYEPVVGIVKDNNDPDGLARVRVEFPFLPPDKADGGGAVGGMAAGKEVSFWAPLAAFGAGEERGWFFLPEVDDEVLVMFEHGDIRRPVVIGALWNGVHEPPPETEDSDNKTRVLHSREGSRIEFFDDGGEGTITLKDPEIGEIIIDTAGSPAILLKAKTGDVCLQAPVGELHACATDIEITATMGKVLFHSVEDQAHGAEQINWLGAKIDLVGEEKIDLNPGGVQGPPGTEAEPKAVDDPIGETGGGGGGGGSSGGASAGGSSAGGSTAGGSGSGGSSTGGSTESGSSSRRGNSPSGRTPEGAEAPSTESAEPEARAFTGRDLGKHIQKGVYAGLRGVASGLGADLGDTQLPGEPELDSDTGEGPLGAFGGLLSSTAQSVVKSSAKAAVQGGDVGAAARSGAIGSIIDNGPAAIIGRPEQGRRPSSRDMDKGQSSAEQLESIGVTPFNPNAGVGGDADDD